MNLSFEKSLLCIVAIAIFLRIPLFGVQAQNDDYLFMAAIERGNGRPSPLMDTKFDLWNFYDGVPEHTAACIRAGSCPWFMAPKAKLALWRPLTSALVTGVHAVFGRRAATHAAFILAVYSFCLIATGMALRRMLRPTVAALALLLFSVNIWDAQVSTWAAACHIPLATGLAMLAILAHIRWRSDGWAPGRILALLCFLAGLAAGEVALFSLPLLVVYEMGTKPDRLGGHLRACAPLGAVALAWLTAYKVLGRGAHGIPGYVDPLGDPALYLSNLWRNGLPKLVSFVSPLRLVASDAPSPLLTLSIALAVPWVALLIARLAFGAAHERKSLLLWIVAALACSVLAGEPSERSMFAATLASSVVAATLLGYGIDLVRQPPSKSVRALAVVACGALAFGFVCVPAVVVADWARVVKLASLATRQTVSQLDLGDAPSSDVVVLVSPDEAMGVWGGTIYEAVHGDAPRSWQVLSLSDGPHLLRRTALDTFELERTGRPFDLGLYRDPQRYPLIPGAAVEAERMRVEAIDVEAGAPRRISVRFDRPLDERTLKFVAFIGSQLRLVPVPPVGEALNL